MKIAIDLDETIFSLKSSIIYKVVNKFQCIKSADPKSANNRKLTFKTVTKEKPINLGFLNFLIPVLNPKKYFIFKDSIETVNALHDAGHEIIFLSNRPSKIKAIKMATLHILNEHKFKYDWLVIGCSNKDLFCSEFNVDVLIDDNIKSCKNTAKLGIPSIWLNKNCKESPEHNVFCTNNWKQVQTYVSFVEYLKSKKGPLLNSPKINFNNELRLFEKVIFNPQFIEKHKYYKNLMESFNKQNNNDFSKQK